MAKAKKAPEVKPVEQPAEIRKELRWDLIALIASNDPQHQEQIQVALESGYEPFAVVPHLLPPDAGSILQPGQPMQPKMANMIWLKRGVMCEIKVVDGADQNANS